MSVLWTSAFYHNLGGSYFNWNVHCIMIVNAKTNLEKHSNHYVVPLDPNNRGIDRGVSLLPGNLPGF